MNHPDSIHLARLQDSRWQWQKFRKGGHIARLRTIGLLNEDRIKSHFARAGSVSRATTGHAVTTNLATGVGTPAARHRRPRTTPNTSQPLVSQPQAQKAA